MISLTISDTKSFMSHLLIKETFDNFLINEASISTANTYTINGELNKSFFTKEELDNIEDDRYSFWSSVKPFCFSLIKGNKVPIGMKLIFMLSIEQIEKFVSDTFKGVINGLFINIKYSNGAVTLVTGTSLNIFTLDKTLEHAFDSYVKQFLDNSGIRFEEL